MNTWKLDETKTLNLFVVNPQTGGLVHAWISARPNYCDRGHYQVNVSGIPDLDGADMFPRYYLSLVTAMTECEKFLEWRLLKVSGEAGKALALLVNADGVPASRF